MSKKKERARTAMKRRGMKGPSDDALLAEPISRHSGRDNSSSILGGSERPIRLSTMSDPSHLAISVSNLTYSHTPTAPPALRDISLHLPPGSRTIICGANGGWWRRFHPSPSYPCYRLFFNIWNKWLYSWKIDFVADFGGPTASHC